ncbi:MAG: efflux RND transporter periplasmic adaptor subunit [Bacteroidales bacterium]|nr:efflux RND transporter periplasmic adaptor subunit [Bacteroidales bacterium]
MKQIKILFALSLVALVVVSCGKKTSVEDPATTEAVADTTVYKVKVMTLAQQKIARPVEYNANLMPYEEINYAPASPGRIEEIMVEIGTRVSKGQVIARMEATQLQQAKEQYENARSNFERMDTLYKLNSISEQVYEGAKTQYEVSKSSYDFLKKNTLLVSPINGIVTGKYFEGGELYSGAPNTPAGKAAIVTLMQINPMKAIVSISEKYFPLTKKGMKADVKVDIFPNRTFKGEISRIYPTISADTRSFEVEIVINNNDEVLRPGMFSRVSINMGQIDALILPAIAVVKQEGTNDRYVFLANGDNTTRKIKVEIGQRFDDKLEIISEELKEGDQVIFAGQDKLMDKSLITIVQ